jgi:hypothetical protein
MPNNWLLNERQQTVDNWLRAAVNFYGFVTPRVFLILFNRYNKPKLLKAELMKYWHKLDVKSWHFYTLYTNAIVSMAVGPKKKQVIQYKQQGKKYYMPTDKELLNYIDPDYYPNTPESERVYQYMRITFKLNQEDAVKFMKKVTWMMRIDEPIDQVLDVLNDFQLVIHDLDQANEFLSLMSDLSNHTRKWSNCGFTPEELYKERLIYREIFSRN